MSDLAIEVPGVDRAVAFARQQGATVLEEPADAADGSTRDFLADGDEVFDHRDRARL